MKATEIKCDKCGKTVDLCKQGEVCNECGDNLCADCAKHHQHLKKFEDNVDQAWEAVKDEPQSERFDKFCELVDKLYDPDIYSAYIRIFYDCGYTGEEMAEDLIDIGMRFEIVNYKVIYTDDFDTVVVILHERSPKNY